MTKIHTHVVALCDRITGTRIFMNGRVWVAKLFENFVFFPRCSFIAVSQSVFPPLMKPVLLIALASNEVSNRYLV